MEHFPFSTLQAALSNGMQEKFSATVKRYLGLAMVLTDFLAENAHAAERLLSSFHDQTFRQKLKKMMGKTQGKKRMPEQILKLLHSESCIERKFPVNRWKSFFSTI